MITERNGTLRTSKLSPVHPTCRYHPESRLLAIHSRERLNSVLHHNWSFCSTFAIFLHCLYENNNNNNSGYYYYFIIIIIIIIIIVSCHRPFLPGTSLEPAVIPTAQASSFTLQYFPYYV